MTAKGLIYGAVLLMPMMMTCSAGEVEPAVSRLTLLKDHLLHVDALLGIRSSLLDIRHDPQIKQILDSKVDPPLLIEISQIARKDIFEEEYRERTAQGLYQKNARALMESFCRYEPKNIQKFFKAISPVLDDCRKLGCSYCNLNGSGQAH